MSEKSLTDLTSALLELRLEAPKIPIDGADILNSLLDLCRSLLAVLLSKLLHCEPDIAYRSIQWPNNLSSGDLTVTLPKLRPGVKPNDYVSELMQEVSIMFRLVNSMQR